MEEAVLYLLIIINWIILLSGYLIYRDIKMELYELRKDLKNNNNKSKTEEE